MTAAQPDPNPKDVPNFGRIFEWLSRGAHPNPAGYTWLTKSARVNTIVNLRAEDNTEVLLAPLGFKPVQIPVIDNAAPSAAQAKQWLDLVADPANRPIFVHCQSGHGRTSTFCMLVRLAQGWKLTDAIEEETKFGFDPDHDPAQIIFLRGIRDLMEASTLALPDLSET